MGLFKAPEGEKLYLWERAKKGLEITKLFMKPEELILLEKGGEIKNEAIEDLWDKKIMGKADPKMMNLEGVEGEAQDLAEKKLPGLRQVHDKRDGLFTSSVR